MQKKDLKENYKPKSSDMGFYHVYLKKATFTKRGKEKVMQEQVQQFAKKQFPRMAPTLPLHGFTEVEILYNPHIGEVKNQSKLLSEKIGKIEEVNTNINIKSERKKVVLQLVGESETAQNSIDTYKSQLETAKSAVDKAKYKATDEQKKAQTDAENALKEAEKKASGADALKLELSEINDFLEKNVELDAEDLKAELKSLESKFNIATQEQEKLEAEIDKALDTMFGEADKE